MSVSLAEPTSSVNSDFQCSTYSFGDSQVLIPGKISGKPDRISCRQCHTSSIHAPEGATFETQYVCHDCSPLGPEDVHFDRCQFDSSGYIHSFSHDDLASYMRAEVRTIFEGDPRPFSPMSEARTRGESWTDFVTTENLSALSERVRRCFILTQVYGLRPREVGKMLGVTGGTVSEYVYLAKSQFRRMDKNRCSPQVSDDRFQATTEREQDAEPDVYTGADLQAAQGKTVRD